MFGFPNGPDDKSLEVVRLIAFDGLQEGKAGGPALGIHQFLGVAEQGLVCIQRIHLIKMILIQVDHCVYVSGVQSQIVGAEVLIHVLFHIEGKRVAMEEEARGTLEGFFRMH